MEVQSEVGRESHGLYELPLSAFPRVPPWLALAAMSHIRWLMAARASFWLTSMRG